MKKKLLTQALNHCQRSLHEHPQWFHYMHWTFVVQRSKIIEWGVNCEGDPPFGMGYHRNSKIHSELSAFRRAKGLLDRDQGWSIINIRLSRRNEFKMSAPCRTCFTWLSSVGCEKAWFTTSSGWAQIKMGA